MPSNLLRSQGVGFGLEVMPVDMMSLVQVISSTISLDDTVRRVTTFQPDSFLSTATAWVLNWHSLGISYF